MGKKLAEIIIREYATVKDIYCVEYFMVLISFGLARCLA